MTSSGKARTRQTPTARQKRVWDKAAPSYDKQIAFFEKIQFAGGREWLGERAQGRILEVAIGTGRNLPHYPADAAVTGIELSPAMLAIARQRAADISREVDFREGDAEHLPFEDGSFDTVVCALSLCTIPSPAAAIGEMKRVLVPGGRLLLLDHIGSTWPPVYAAQWLLERITVPTAGEHFTRRQLPLVQAAGFQVTETERLKAGSVERIHAVKPVSPAASPKAESAADSLAALAERPGRQPDLQGSDRRALLIGSYAPIKLLGAPSSSGSAVVCASDGS